MVLQADGAKPVCPECGISAPVYPDMFGESGAPWVCGECEEGIETPEVKR